MEASAYHRNMELIASDSSLLDVLSIQQVSTQAQSQPSLNAKSQKLMIFCPPSENAAPEAFVSGRDAASSKETSPSPHVWDRMANGGMSPMKSFSWMVDVLSNLIVDQRGQMSYGTQP